MKVKLGLDQTVARLFMDYDIDDETSSFFFLSLPSS